MAYDSVKEQELHDRVEHNMTNHPPVDDGIVLVFEELRRRAKDFAHMVVVRTPPGREQSLALTAVEEALMWAVAAVARNQAAVVEAHK